MRKQKLSSILTIVFMIVALSCTKEDNNPISDCENDDFFCQFSSRDFKMGFSTWPYAPTAEAVEGSYKFIDENADIYSEHIDSNIPWNAWFNDSTLPSEFINEIESRASRKLPNAQLTVSVSLLNSSRDELAFDYDGGIPDYAELNDQKIEDAYFKHLKYIANQLNPDYLIIAIEVNELLKNAPEKWDGYKLLMASIRSRIAEEFPSLNISESITLHNFYQPDVTNSEDFIEEIANYANAMDLVSISFYPFFKGLKTDEDFKEAFDFLHEQIEKPISFAETSHLSEDLTVESFNLSISGDQGQQNEYLKVLLAQAQIQDYEYIIWWAHRDYDLLWETFPDEVKDLGKLWISTGLITEDGIEKEAYSTWEEVLNK
ncbi:glycosyl hydrolase 53 family protein [uncultured Marivirga sp.]|uniref:glycosyl hydrolase 53 family protein n=1 Tax=uncultured Marivirga sp. TaxID=1123707 RepID=UPI0030EDEBBA